MQIPSAEAWYEAATQLTARAEDLSNPTDTYVDTVFLRTLRNKRNQVLFGRRGTGKTHLLRRLQDELFTHFEDLRIVPIYIDGATLEGAISPHSDPAAIALSVYVELLKRTVRELSLFIGDKIRPGILDWLFSGPKQDLLLQARTAASRLDLLLAQGQVRMLPVGDASAEFEDLDEAVSQRRIAAGINASVTLSDPRGLGVKIDAAAAKELRKTAKKVTTRTIGGEIYLPFAEVTELIRQLLATLGDASLAILVDEWSALNQADVQPLLAQLLKLTARRGICLKLACVPGRTKLFLRGPTQEGWTIGLESGEDITADVNLDSVVFVDNDIKQLTEFFVALLQCHMGIEIPQLAGITFDSFWNYVVNDRMGKIGVLAELCHASGAVPRDFISVFRQATITQQAAGSEKMTTSHVRSAAGSIYEGKRENLKASRPDELLLLDRIYRKVVFRQKSYFFLVETSLAEDPRIVGLFTAKLIHRTPATWLDPDTMVSYVYYLVDYGTSLELMRQFGAKAWEDYYHGIGVFKLIKWLPRMRLTDVQLQKTLDNYVSSFAAARLDVEPRSLIVDLEMIEGPSTSEGSAVGHEAPGS